MDSRLKKGWLAPESSVQFRQWLRVVSTCCLFLFAQIIIALFFLWLLLIISFVLQSCLWSCCISWNNFFFFSPSGPTGPQNGWNDPPSLSRVPKKKKVNSQLSFTVQLYNNKTHTFLLNRYLGRWIHFTTKSGLLQLWLVPVSCLPHPPTPAETHSLVTILTSD